MAEQLNTDTIAEIQSTNVLIRGWAKRTVLGMKSRIIRHGVKDNMVLGEITEDLKSSVSVRNMVADKISFTFPRYGVWFEKGASKGHGGNEGRTRWRKRSGGEGKTDPKSLGKMNSGNRKEKPWFNPELKTKYPELEQIVLQSRGRISLKQLKGVLIK